MNNQVNPITPITLLRVEGVNLDYSINDTEQLSTRRGGGLLLLEAIRTIANNYKACLYPISTGASAGLFTVLDGCKAEDIAKKIREYLASDDLYKHATFMVAISEDKFPVAKEQLLAKIRWQQMQSLTFTIPGLKEATGDYTVCTFDEVRPAHTTVEVRRDEPDPVERKVSNSVQMRHDYGRIKKQARKNRYNIEDLKKYQNIKGFYEEELAGSFLLPWEGMSNYFKRFYKAELEGKFCFAPEVLELIYTQHFEDLAMPLPPDIEPKELSGKMAVFYADGNKFGRIDRGCKSHEKLKEWDDYIKDQRRKLLAEIVTRAYQYDHWKASQVGKIRLEILLWGGDELIFVMPGWCGMEFAQLFFEATEHMKYKMPAKEEQKTDAEVDQKPKPEPKPESLTHACGLVFCHHQAPISGITKLAKKLADAVKRPSGEKQENLLNWMVLESFDHAQADLDDLKKARYPHYTPEWNAIALTDKAVTALHDNLPGLKDDLPRSVLVRIVRMMACGAAFKQPEKPKDMAVASDKTLAPAKPEDDAGIPDKLLIASYRSLDETISKMADQGERFKALWHILKLKPITEKCDSKSPEEQAEARRKAESEAQWNPDLPKPEDMAAWVKLLELWDYCPGLYSSEGDVQ